MAEGSECPARLCRDEVPLDVEGVVGGSETDRNRWADSVLSNPCTVRALRRVG